VFLFGLGNI